MDWDFEWEFGPGGYLRGIWRVLTGLASVLGGLLLLLLFIAVAVLLIRYLLIATRAAQLYVDAHEPERPAGSGDTGVGPEPPTPAPADDAPTKPARTSRSPKTPRTPSTS